MDKELGTFTGNICEEHNFAMIWMPPFSDPREHCDGCAEDQKKEFLKTCHRCPHPLHGSEKWENSYCEFCSCHTWIDKNLNEFMKKNSEQDCDCGECWECEERYA